MIKTHNNKMLSQFVNFLLLSLNEELITQSDFDFKYKLIKV